MIVIITNIIVIIITTIIIIIIIIIIIRMLDFHNQVTHYWDMFIFAPRRFSATFSSFWKRWLKCNGNWTGEYRPVDAYANGATGAGARYVDKMLPVVIKRMSSNETTAKWLCGRTSALVSVEECMSIVYEDERPRDNGTWSRVGDVPDSLERFERL